MYRHAAVDQHQCISASSIFNPQSAFINHHSSIITLTDCFALLAMPCANAMQVAKVDSFQLSQYELYSSRVKDFEVRGRQAHPRAQGGEYSKSLNTSGWQLMGKYTAAKMKGSQVCMPS